MAMTPEGLRPIGPSGGVRTPDSFAQRSPNGRSTGGSEEQLANVLGWVSLGLGIMGLAAPEAVARMVGVPDTDENRNIIRGIGVREIASGVGILSQPRPTEWVWSRVAGDVMDLTLLGKAMTGDDTDRDRLTKATVAVAGRKHRHSVIVAARPSLSSVTLRCVTRAAEVSVVAPVQVMTVSP